jgi:putative redox protein
MVTITSTYKGGLHCEAVHGPSKAKLQTDAPVDNHGKGATFSPTDLVATALGVCYLTIMGISAEDHNINMTGTTATVEKHMSEDKPRRIAKLVIKIDFCEGIPFKYRGLLEAVAINSPTTKSLHPDIAIDYSFNFPD